MVCSGPAAQSASQAYSAILGDGRLPAMQQSSAAQYAQCLQQLRAYTFGGTFVGRHITIMHIPTYALYKLEDILYANAEGIPTDKTIFVCKLYTLYSV